MKKWYMADKTASTKAIEELYDNDLKLYDDEYSKFFTVGVNKFFLNIMKKEKSRDRIMAYSENIVPGVYGLIASRSRYIDDILTECISDGFAQVVNLGSGFDTRIFRIPNVENVSYFMMDFPEVMKEFKIRSEKNKLPILNNLTLVSIDLNKTSIEKALKDTCFDKNKKTLFIWEGVTQYIDSDAVNSTLDFVSKTNKQSKIIFSYVLKDVIDNPENFIGSKKVIAMTKKVNAPWVFGFDPKTLNDYLEKLNLQLENDVGHEYYKKKYTQLTARNLELSNLERIAVAKVK